MVNGICRDLRLRPGERGEERRLATVRQPHEPDVRDEPELEVEVALLARVSQLAGAGRLARRRRETGVAASAPSAACPERHSAGTIEIGEHEVAFANDRSHRDVEGQIRAVVTRPLAAGAGAAILGGEGASLPKAGERGVRGVGDHDDIATAAAIATVRTAIGHVLLTPEADGSPPA